VKALARRLNVTAASCGVPRFVALTQSVDGELQISDICMQQKPTAYHFMNPGERSAYLMQFRGKPTGTPRRASALSLADERGTCWISLQGSGVHPCAEGSYSVREYSPFHEHFPCRATRARCQSSA